MNEPNLFVIGAPKCGTTSLLHYLEEHPQVFVSKVKEPHFFNSDSKHRYYYSEENYLKLFEEATPKHKYRCEGSVWYLYSKSAIDEILRFDPEAKFIVMLRNPVSMFFSLHQELYFGGAENNRSPIEAWYLQTKRKIGKNIPMGCRDVRFLQYLEVCRLGHQVQLAKSKIKSSNLKIVFLEDLEKRPEDVFNEVLNFLKIDSLNLNNFEVINPKKIRRSQLVSRILIALNKIKSNMGITIGVGLSNFISRKNTLFNEVLSHNDYKDFSMLLKNQFFEDIELLEQVVIKDLSHWK